MTALVERLSFLQGTAQEKLLLAKQRSEEYNDNRSNHKNFKIGDFVWLQSESKQHKFEKLIFLTVFNNYNLEKWQCQISN